MALVIPRSSPAVSLYPSSRSSQTFSPYSVPASTPSNQAYWNPEDVFGIDPSSHRFTCVGTTQKGLRCKNSFISNSDRALAADLLFELSYHRSLTPDALEILREIAEVTLCPRWHRKPSHSQIDRMVWSWAGMMQSHLTFMASTARRAAAARASRLERVHVRPAEVPVPSREIVVSTRTPSRASARVVEIESPRSSVASSPASRSVSTITASPQSSAPASPASRTRSTTTASSNSHSQTRQTATTSSRVSEEQRPSSPATPSRQPRATSDTPSTASVSTTTQTSTNMGATTTTTTSTTTNVSTTTGTTITTTSSTTTTTSTTTPLPPTTPAPPATAESQATEPQSAGTPSTPSTSAAAAPPSTPSPSGPRRKPLTDDCPVCMEPCNLPAPFDNDEAINSDTNPPSSPANPSSAHAIYCRVQCGTNIHRACFETYRAHQLQEFQDLYERGFYDALSHGEVERRRRDCVKCVFCRQRWPQE